MAWSNILLEKEGYIGILVLNRPAALNSLNTATLGEIDAALDAVDADDAIKVLIVTGAGNKSFAAGADIVGLQGLTPLDAKQFSLFGQQVFNKLENFRKPVIAAVNGFALGGGCELAMCADLRLATPKSRFGLPEVSLGVIPGYAGTQRLPRLVGKGRAKEMIMTGDFINADEAFRIGLVNKIVTEEKLLDEAKEFATKIAARSQTAVRLAKEAVNRGLGTDLTEGGRIEAELFALCFSREDSREGIAAFLGKRPAVFPDK